MLLDDAATKRILGNAIAAHAVTCQPSRFSVAMAVEKDLSAVDARFVEAALTAATGNQSFDGASARRTLGHNGVVDDYSNKVAEQNRKAIAAAQEAAQHKSAQDAKAQRLKAFASKYNIGGWAQWAELRANPFAKVGKIYLFNAQFERMVSATSGVFSGTLFTNVPSTAFTKPVHVMIAGRVVGATNIKNQFGAEVQVPNIEYLGHEPCQMRQCDEYNDVPSSAIFK